jgi:hypothetical protein
MFRKILIGLATAGLLLAPAVAGADPTTESPGEVGRGVQQLLDGAESPSVAPIPAQPIAGGTAVLLSQDNGNGEHASILVANAVRDGVSGRAPSVGNVDAWDVADFGETQDSNDVQSVYTFTAGGERFLVTVTRAGS